MPNGCAVHGQRDREARRGGLRHLPHAIPALTSAYTRDQFKSDVFPRMAQMSSQAFPVLVQKRIVARDQARTFGGLDRLADYISSVNLSSAPEYKYELKGSPRPKGADTHVIITSYDLPRKSMQPHDAVKGDDGFVWLSDFGENSLQGSIPKPER